MTDGGRIWACFEMCPWFRSFGNRRKFEVLLRNWGYVAAAAQTFVWGRWPERSMCKVRHSARITSSREQAYVAWHCRRARWCWGGNDSFPGRWGRRVPAQDCAMTEGCCWLPIQWLKSCAIWSQKKSQKSLCQWMTLVYCLLQKEHGGTR